MQLIKKTGLRFLIFMLILTGLSQVYKHFYYEKDLKQYSPIGEQLENAGPDCEVVYLAESSNFTSAPNDRDKRGINSMASDYFEDLEICAINKGALHAGFYKVIMQNLKNRKALKTVIVTMNLRSFGADWIYSELETSLQKQILLLEEYPPFVNRIRLAFRAYDIKTKEERHAQVLRQWDKKIDGLPEGFAYQTVNEWDIARANGSFLNPDGTWDMPKIILSCHFVKNYAFLIDVKNNPRIKDFDAIVELAKKNHWNLVFNLLAENTERAGKLTEPELLELMERNRDILVDRYTNKGVIVVDNLNAVADSLFIDRDWPTEHYAETGRRIIARNLADSLKKIYHERFKVSSTVK